MKKSLLWLTLCLTALPAHAYLNQEAGQPIALVEPPAIRFPASDTIPGCSIAAGYHSLYRQYLPASYCNIGIGYDIMQGLMTTAAVNNIGLGYKACRNITTAHDNICIGSAGPTLTTGPGAGLTTGSNNIHIGAGSGNNYTTAHDNIIFEGEGVVSGNSGNNNVLIDGHGGWIGSNSILLSLDGAYQQQFAGQFVLLIGINAGRLNVDNGAGENNIIIIGGDQNAAPNTHDVATATSNNVISVGGGTTFGVKGNKPGTFDTAYGLNALGTNAQDSAKQAAFGNNALSTSNIANAQNSAFGYQAGKLITTGTNNALLGYTAGAATLTTGGSNIIIGSGQTSLAAGTASELNISGLVFGHLAGSSVPVLSACGTSPAVDANANNASGEVTTGSGALASCTVTFASAYTTWDHCRVFSQTGSLAGFAYTYTTAAITITGTSITSKVFDYVCDGF